ncbi:MAG TPA: transferrin receptor-like dimerization domain-containing protein, partial [Gemmatimonadaceae bacterium]|nr:transferrin receptor-like dimerization domain-containing protein [Gemmatimonadaceae bacterium]
GPAGVYHSAYDSFEWMRTWGDPGYLFHATAARIGAAMALRLANADVHPYDYVEYAATMQRYVPLVTRGLARQGWDTALVTPLDAAIRAMAKSAEQFGAERDRRLATGLSKGARERTNAALRRVERELTRPSGLLGRPWWRSLIYAADVDNGYATMSFPGVNEAVRAGDADRARTELADLTAAFTRATASLDAAREALGSR